MRNRIIARVFEDVVQRLRLEIAKGTLQPGDRLPTERELSSKFQVERGSIREAVRLTSNSGGTHANRRK